MNSSNMATQNNSSASSPARQPRTTHRGEARRILILQVATQKFLEKGYAGVSVDEIVKEVGGSKTNVYRQFKNKEGLFVAVVEDLCSNFLHDFLRIDISGLDATSGLRLLGKSLLHILLQDKHIAFQRLILAESGRYPALARTWFEDGPVQTRHFFAKHIAARQGMGEIRPRDPMVLAAQFHSIIVFDPTHLAMLGEFLSDAQIDQHVESTVESLLRGWNAR